MTRADQHEEWAADRVSKANGALRAGVAFDSVTVQRHLEVAADQLSKANAA